MTEIISSEVTENINTSKKGWNKFNQLHFSIKASIISFILILIAIPIYTNIQFNTQYKQNAASSDIQLTVNLLNEKLNEPFIYPEFNSKNICGSSQLGYAQCFLDVVTDSNGKVIMKNSPDDFDGNILNQISQLSQYQNIINHANNETLIATSKYDGYSPLKFHLAYLLPCTPGGPLAISCPLPKDFGPTIAIVEAYTTPKLDRELQIFDEHYGIAPCTQYNGCLNIVNQSGGSQLPSIEQDSLYGGGWSLESALDVEVVHSLCQTCKIVVVDANDESYNNLTKAENYAASIHPISISNSWGIPEQEVPINIASGYNPLGIAVVAASGDSGYKGNLTSLPASYPSVISIGGTTLTTKKNYQYITEKVWSLGGSGCSQLYSSGSWQSALSNWNKTGCRDQRAVADISADANPNTGVAIYGTYSGVEGWNQVGGTSLAAPIIASEVALSGKQIPTRGLNPLLYSNNSPENYHDITVGTNGKCGTIICEAGVGYDGPTGLGSPNSLGAFGGPSLTFQPLPTPSTGPTETLVPIYNPPNNEIRFFPKSINLTVSNTGTYKAITFWSIDNKSHDIYFSDWSIGKSNYEWTEILKTIPASGAKINFYIQSIGKTKPGTYTQLQQLEDHDTGITINVPITLIVK